MCFCLTLIVVFHKVDYTTHEQGFLSKIKNYAQLEMRCL